jgi:hypothetical protein
MVTIQTKKSKLIATLKYLKAVLKGKSSKSLSTICEITITNGQAVFAIPGAIFTLYCKTEGVAKLTVPFLYFWDIIKNHNSQDITMKINKGEVTIGPVTFMATTCFIENDRILRTIQLPINYTDADLLRLPEQGYTKEELEFNRLPKMISDARKRLDGRITKAAGLFKDLGVTEDEIRTIVDAKI